MKERILSQKMIYISLAVSGAVVWMVISVMTNKKEAWDSEEFWTIGFPLMLLINAIAGFIDPNHIMLKGIISVLLNPIVMIISSKEIGSMFPFGLIVFGVLGVLFSIGGLIGAFIKSKFFNKIQKI